MLYLHRAKTVTLFGLAFFLCSVVAVAQRRPLYQEDHDNKPYYFGITLAGSKTGFHTTTHPYYLAQDTVLVTEPTGTGGFALGLSATARLAPRLEGRFNPTLQFAERNLQYKLRYPDVQEGGTDINKKVESVILSFPLQFKFNSDRIGNFRVYLLGGGKLDYDLASNAKARQAEDMVKIEKLDYGVEGGMGFNFYFPSFILSPEVKFSNGLRNMHSRDQNLKYSNVIDRIQSRMIVFSIHLEG